jgi:microcystin-dependent protein
VETPVGAVLPYAGPINPTTQAILQGTGWLFCDGSLVSAWMYPELFATLGGAYGTSRTTGTPPQIWFYLPDYRGVFLRGVTRDATRGPPQAGMARDPDANERAGARYDTASGQYQGNTGNAVGSTQTDAYLAHEHSYQQATTTPMGTPLGSFAQQQYMEGSLFVQTAASTDELSGSGGKPPFAISTTETRPLNAAVNYIIKAQSRVLPSPAAHCFSTCLKDCWGQQGCESCPASKDPAPPDTSSGG